MRKSSELLDQIIEVAKAGDLEQRKKNMKNKASQVMGDSWMVFHLKQLKEALQQEDDQV